jgi:hypothetical protein
MSTLVTDHSNTYIAVILTIQLNIDNNISINNIGAYIVAYLLHARTAEPQKQPFLSNTCMQQWNKGIMQPASRQWLSKHTSAQAQ